MHLEWRHLQRIWPRLAAFAIAALAIIASSGCYNGDALVEAARSTATKTRLVEVDFGTIQATLPRDQETNSWTELKLHVFGTVPRYRVKDIKKQLKAEEYRLQSETLGELRNATREELAEPNLTQLRKRIEKVLNSILVDAPVKSIGFYEVSVQQR